MKNNLLDVFICLFVYVFTCFISCSAAAAACSYNLYSPGTFWSQALLTLAAEEMLLAELAATRARTQLIWTLGDSKGGNIPAAVAAIYHLPNSLEQL